MNKSKMKLCGVALTQCDRQKSEVISALTWLDIKVSEFKADCQNYKFDSRRGVKEFSEIIGVLKFLHMANIVTKEECNSIVKNITAEI